MTFAYGDFCNGDGYGQCGLDVILALPSGTCTRVAILKPSAVALSEPKWDKSGVFAVCPEQLLEVILSASFTQQPFAASDQADYNFTARTLVQPRLRQPSMVRIWRLYLEFTNTWNVLTIGYSWWNVFSSTAAVFNVCLTAIFFLFPIRAIAEHRIEFRFRRTPGRSAQAEAQEPLLQGLA